MKNRCSINQPNMRFYKDTIMYKPFSPQAIAIALLSLSCLVAAPARAASLVTFVSGKGTDTGICATAATACRSFQFAVNQTTAGGQINALNPANYGGVTIAKAISISGVDGTGIDRSSGDAITINAGPNDAVNLRHLTIDGLRIAQNGIVLNSGGALTINDCAVRNFANSGIVLVPTGRTKFLIGDTRVLDNSGTGLAIAPQGAGSVIGTLDHVAANNNSNGISVTGFATRGAPIDVTAIDSTATNNFFGFGVGPAGILRLAHSVATGNDTGVFINTGAAVESFGDNDIHGNRTNDVQGRLTPIATR
ncbi:MAG: right-handed parallel beta-helix repeat-containing protein [Methylococcales bacterium]|nr:right-handed parallel beta-helix repeat-containing protein [Methylococcales bacterium]